MLTFYRKKWKNEKQIQLIIQFTNPRSIFAFTRVSKFKLKMTKKYFTQNLSHSESQIESKTIVWQDAETFNSLN